MVDPPANEQYHNNSLPASPTMASDLSPSLTLVRQATWEVFILLLVQADFDNAEGCAVALTEIDFTDKVHGYDLLGHVLRGLSTFTLETVDMSDSEDESADLMPFLQRLAYRRNPHRIEVAFNPEALIELRQLQEGVVRLQRQDKLTKANLTRIMRQIAPRTTYTMVIKRLSSDPASFVRMAEQSRTATAQLALSR